MLAKLQLRKQGCIECLKQGLEHPESEVVYLPQCLGSSMLSKDAASLQRAGFPMLHLPGNVSHWFTACSIRLSSVIAPGSC